MEFVLVLLTLQPRFPHQDSLKLVLNSKGQGHEGMLNKCKWIIGKMGKMPSHQFSPGEINFVSECWGALCWLEGTACMEKEKKIKTSRKEWVGIKKGIKFLYLLVRCASMFFFPPTHESACSNCYIENILSFPLWQNPCEPNHTNGWCSGQLMGLDPAENVMFFIYL